MSDRYEPTYLGEIELNEETLAHYGVKGMKWRHRKQFEGVRRNRRRVKSDLRTGYKYGWNSSDNPTYAGKTNMVTNKEERWTPINGENRVEYYKTGGERETAPSKHRKQSNRPRSRQRNVTGSGSGAYRRGSKLGYRVGG